MARSTRIIPPNLTNTHLLARAFFPTIECKIDRSELLKLYGEAPYYADDGTLRGTINENQSFSSDEQKSLTRFNKQCTALFKNIIDQCKELGISNIENLTLFSERFLSRRYYQDQRHAIYYAQVKSTLEDISLKLAGNTLISKSEKMRIMSRLLHPLHLCSGVYSYMTEADSELSSEFSIESWNANLLETTIHQLADLRFQEKSLKEGMHLHVRNAFKMRAHKNGWYHGKLYEDSYADRVVTESDLIWFEAELLKRFNPTAIINELVTLLRLHFGNRITNECDKINADNKKLGLPESDFLEFKNFDDLSTLFKGLPIIGADNAIDTLFDVTDVPEEKPESKECKSVKQPPFLRIGGVNDLRLKSPRDMVLSLTRFFVRLPPDEQLFQSFNINEEDKVQLLVDRGYTLVPGSFELCHLQPKKGIEAAPLPFDEKTYPYYKNLSIDLRKMFDLSFLHYAAKLGDVGMIRILLNEGEDAGVLTTTEPKLTPIQIAVAAGHWEAVRAFAVKRDDTGSFRYGDAILHAAKANRKDVVVALAPQANHAIMWKFDDTGMTALHWAAQHGDADMIRALLSSGDDASPLTKTKPKHTPIQIAVAAGHWEAVRAFAVKQDDTGSFRYGDAILHAARANRKDVVVALASQTKPGSAWKFVDTGMTALHWAAQHGDADMIRALLSSGADASALTTTEPKRTPIQIAVATGHWEAVRAFAVKRDDTGSFRYGDAILHAAKANRKDVVVALAPQANHAIMWKFDDTGMTALHWAAHRGDAGLISALVKVCVNVNIENSLGQTPLEVALISNHNAVISAFSEDAIEFALLRAIKHKDSSKIRLLMPFVKSSTEIILLAIKIMGYGYGVEWMKHFSFSMKTTALNLAAKQNCQETVCTLLAFGASLTQKDKNGMTALDWAIKNKNPAMVRALILSGAKLADCKMLNRPSSQTVSHSILQAVLQYTKGEGCSIFSSINSARRRNDIAELTALLTKQTFSHRQTQEKIAAVVKYCHSMQTGFFGRSALRDKVLAAVQTLEPSTRQTAAPAA